MTKQSAKITASIFLVFSLLCSACSRQSTPYNWDLPPGIKPPSVPEDNPLTVEKIALGKQLFYDTALSANKTQSCSTCHQQKFAFSEPRATSIGSTTELHLRNAPTLTNVAYNSTLTWAHPHLKTIERQLLIPLFGEEPAELNVTGNEKRILDRFRKSQTYKSMFRLAFPNDKNPVNFNNIVKALGSFTRTLVSFNSPFDRYAWYAEDDALSNSELRGMTLFMSEQLECRHCHGGFNFSLSTVHQQDSILAAEFHNIGLYNPDAPITLDEGVYELTEKEKDRGLFRPPTLRNIEYTAPYMHDGSLATLEEVIDFYAAGGREILDGPMAGDGRKHPNKSIFLHGFTLTKDEKSDLLAFLKSLSDKDFLQNPDYAPAP